LRERWALAALGIGMLAVAALYLVERPASEPPPLPDDPLALARRLRAHPADWRAAGALSEHALDAPVPNRFALWRAAHDAAMHLAPTRQAPRMELAREAFFHWHELSPGDRKAALDLVAPLLRDVPTFFTLAKPLFDLTGDLGMLRRWNPGTVETIEYTRNVAATYGRFDDYRELRAEVTRKREADFHAKVHELSPADIVAALPKPPYSTDDEPLLREALAELHRRPLTEDPHRPAELDALVDYGLRHHLDLDGVDSITHIAGSASDVTRYRLAEAFAMNAAAYDIRLSAKEPLTVPRGTWQQLRDDGAVNARSWIDREMTGPASIAIQTVAGDEVPPYVEIYYDDARVAEGDVATSRTFAIPSTGGLHRIEVRVANPITRNAAPRRVKVISVAP